MVASPTQTVKSTLPPPRQVLFASIDFVASVSAQAPGIGASPQRPMQSSGASRVSSVRCVRSVGCVSSVGSVLELRKASQSRRVPVASIVASQLRQVVSASGPSPHGPKATLGGTLKKSRWAAARQVFQRIGQRLAPRARMIEMNFVASELVASVESVASVREPQSGASKLRERSVEWRQLSDALQGVLGRVALQAETSGPKSVEETRRHH